MARVENPDGPAATGTSGSQASVEGGTEDLLNLILEDLQNTCANGARCRLGRNHHRLTRVRVDALTLFGSLLHHDAEFDEPGDNEFTAGFGISKLLCDEVVQAVEDLGDGLLVFLGQGCDF